MAQVALRFFRGVPVVYGFRNRTKSVNLPAFVRERDLREELESIQTLRFSPAEINFLRASPYIPAGMFSEAFLAFLKNLRLPDFELESHDSTFRIEVAETWKDTILWETLILSVVNELYYRTVLKQNGADIREVWKEGERRLLEKIAKIKGDPRVRFSDFGTRRRFSGPWQRHVVEILAEELPEQFIGTSNVLFAKELGLRPIGTFAHEMDMVYSGVYHGSDEEIRASHNKVLQDWWAQYGEPLSIALTDTYGTDFFFKDFTPEQAQAWRGLRQDSGDPFAFGEKAIAFYQKYGIDPRTKTIVFSDGLEVEMILALTDRFYDRTQIVFGWGTNLTNDLGFVPLSVVVKILRSCGYGAVKLSDNLDKALGTPEDIERFMRIFGHTDIKRLGVKY